MVHILELFNLSIELSWITFIYVISDEFVEYAGVNLVIQLLYRDVKSLSNIFSYKSSIKMW